MSWLGKCIFPCWGTREQGGRNSSAAQQGSKMNQDPNELAGFTGEMPPFEEKPKTKPANYYVNGVEDQSAEKLTDLDSDSLFDQSNVVSVEVQTTEGKPIYPDSDSSDQVTVVESIDTVNPDRHEDLHFCGSTNAIPAEPSGKLMAIFSWISEIRLDSLELLSVIPGSDKKSGLVEGIFRYNDSLVPIFIPGQYAEQRQCQPRCSGASQAEAQVEETSTNHWSGNQGPLLRSTGFLPLPPTPPTTPTPIETTDPAQPNNLINCSNLEAFSAWAQAPSQV